MHKVKLSECTKQGLVFLYGGETVALQYILRMIFREMSLPQIHLVADEKQFDKAVSGALSKIYDDIKNGSDNGIDEKDYSLGKLKTYDVIIDISQSDIKQIDEEGYEFEVILR